MPRELTNVSGKSVLSWLLGSLKVRADAPAALAARGCALLLSAPVRRALQTQSDDRIYIVHHAEIGKYEAFHTVRPSLRDPDAAP